MGGLWPLSVDAQGLTDEVLIFSQSPTAGSARIQAMGFSQVALGGDLSSAFSNPAGLGFYNKSEVTFSPALNFNSTNSYLELSKEVEELFSEISVLSEVGKIIEKFRNFLNY